MHVYYQMLIKIKEQLNQKSDVRKKSTYELGDDDTDTEPATRGLRGEFLPPFTSFYKKRDNENKKELKWAGDISEGGFEEVNFVYELLSAAKMYFDKRNELAETENGGFGNNGPSGDINNFIPLTIYDIANSDRIENPYTYVAEKIKNNADYEEVAGDIYAIFSLRLFYYMSCFSDGGANLDENEALCFSRFEAINFFKAVGKSSSPTLKQAIELFTNGGIKKSNKSKRSWVIENSKTTRDKLFAEENASNWFYAYSGHKKVGKNGAVDVQFDAFPMGVGNLNKLKDDFSNGIPIYEEGYISTSAHEYYSGLTGDVCPGRTLNGGTFLLYEDGTYLNRLYNNINDEINAER